MKNDGLLTSMDLARRWGLHPSTPANWRRLRRGPAYVRLENRRVLYRLDAVKEYETKHTIRPRK